VTDEDDMEHWWNDGCGKTGLLRGTAVPVPFFHNLSHIDWFVKHRSVDGDQSPEPYATQDCYISADIKQIDKALTIAKMVKS
jgi:hypothetical protein